MKKRLATAKLAMAALCALGVQSLSVAQSADKELKISFDGEGQVLAVQDTNVKVEFSGKPLFSDAKKGKGVLIDAEGVSANGLKISGPNLMNAKQGTIAFWMKPVLPPSSDSRHYILKATGSGTDNALYVFIDKDGSLYLQTKKDGAWLSPHFNFAWWGKPAWQENTWYHLAITWEPNAKTKFYANGSLVFEDKSAYPGFDNVLDKLAIGNDGSGNAQINAVLDDMIISPRAMPQAEISKLASE